MARAREWPAARAAAACGVPENQILTLAAWMAESDAMVMAIGNGQERGRNGGSGIRAAIALPALLGKLGKGSGIVLGAGNAFPKTPAKLTRPDLLPGPTRTLDLVDMGRHLTEDDLDPPLRALFIYNHNPLVVHADQNRMRRGLMREDVFMVGIEIAMTESMALCDVILPAATQFEQGDLYAAYGHHWLQRAERVIPPVGEALPNTEIFRRLAARFGFNDPALQASDRDLMNDAIDGADPKLGGVAPSKIPTDRALAMRYDGEPAVMFRNVFPKTASGKVELASPYLEQRWGARLPSYRPFRTAYPLILITPASDKRTTSTFGGVRGNEETPPLEIHPDDAAARGIADGDMVRVFNGRGSHRLRARVNGKPRRGVVVAPSVWWKKHSPDGGNANNLTSQRTSDLGGGATFYDCRVQVERA